MKIAVLSDIHGNYIALEACVKVIRKEHVDAIIFLGDYLGELAYPRRTLDALARLEQEYECIFLRGNKEDYWINYTYRREEEWKYGSTTTGMLLYDYEALTEQDIEKFMEFPYAKHLEMPGFPKIAIYHGSNGMRGDKLPLNKDNSHILFDDTDAKIVLCGHTHRRNVISRGDRILLNPGAVGLSLGAGGKAQFMILESAGLEEGNALPWAYQMFDVSYDVGAAIEELREEGLYEKAPYWTRMTERVLHGLEPSHGHLLKRAMQLYYNDIGQWVWPEIPEEYFEKALAILDKNA